MSEIKFNTEEQIPTNEELFNVRKVFDKLYDHWPAIGICLIAGLITAFLLNRYATPVYEVHTSALIKAPKEIGNAVSELLYGEELFGRNVTNMENEAFLLNSHELVTKTIKDLNLETSYYRIGQIRDEELYLNSPIKLSLDTTSTLVPHGRSIRCKIIDDQDYTLQFVEESFLSKVKNIFSEKDTALAILKDERTIGFGENVNINGFKFRIDYDPTNNDPLFENEILLTIHQSDELTSYHRLNLDVQPLSPESSILSISFKTTNRQKGADFLNQLVQNYIADELDRKNFTASKTIDFINGQILLMGDSLSEVETRMETFKQSNTDLTLSNEGSNFMQMSQQFDSERNQLALSNRYLQDLERQVSQNNLDEVYIPSSIGVNDPGLNKSVQDLVDLQLQIKAISSTKNPIVISAQQKIGVLKQNILENIRSIKSTNNLAIGSINRQVGSMRSTLRSLPKAERQFINIQRNYNLSEDLFLFLMQKKSEAEIAKASNTIDYRVIDHARPTGSQVSPNRTFNYLFGLFFGLGIPSIVIFIIGALNNKVNSKEMLLGHSKIPYLGMIPKSKGTKLINDSKAQVGVAESFRTIRSNLRYMLGKDSSSKVFLLTSSVSSEGKTFCANNLSYIFSNFGKKVILVNADMRKDNEYGDFGVINNIGLSDYLAGLNSKEEIIQKTYFPNLHIIPSGGIPPNPSELLIGGGIEALIDELKLQFDFIIIDTPPIGILADGLELIEKSDISIFIVRQDVTLLSHLKEANDFYTHYKINNMAVLLNSVESKKIDGYYNNYYNQYNRKSKGGTKPVKVLSSLDT